MPKVENLRCFPKEATIFLKGAISISTAKKMRRALERINQKNSPTRFICLFIDSLGGDLAATYEIWQVLRPYQERLITIACHYVGSGGVLLIQSGSWRFAVPKTQFYIHGTLAQNEMAPLFSRLAKKNFVSASEFLFVVGQINRLLVAIANANIFQLSILTEHQPEAKNIEAISAMLDGERTFSAHRARQLNLLDKVLKSKSLSGIKKEIVKYLLDIA